MWLAVGIFVTSIFWINIQGQNEVLKNGLPVSCGIPAGPQPPAEKHERLKTESKNHSWPWHVGIYYSAFGAYPFCGGTLISPSWVITAAHCILMALQCKNVTLGKPFSFDDVTGHTMAVLIGAHNFKEQDGPGYNIRVKHAVVHPEFPVDESKKGIDIALLKLDRDVKRSRHVAFACVPQKEKLSSGRACYVAGWGLIPNPQGDPSQDQPEKLMEKPATITDISGCNHVFKSVTRKVHICTKQGPVTSCVGDSGGGLHCKANDGRWTVYGVASFAPPRCVGEYYVASSTDYVFEWIKNTVLGAN